ncbi:methyltransferase family protein [Patescibacteria group bacterium]
MVDIVWTTVVVLWTLIAITFSITKIKVHRSGGGIYNMEKNPLKKKEKWIIRALALIYIVLAFIISYKFNFPFFDDFHGVTRSFFVKTGFTLFVIAQFIYIRARIAISSNWDWNKKRKGDQKKLIKKGPYKKVRHPQYTAYLLAVLATGIMLVESGILLFFILLIPLVVLKMKVEEECLKIVFPKEYSKYIKETRMFI